MSQNPSTFDGPPLPPAVESVVEEARALERSGDFAAARRRYEELLHRLPAGDGPRTAAALLRWVGSTHREEGDGKAALDCYAASLAVAESGDDRLNMAHAYNCMSVIHLRWGDLDRAVSHLTRARELAEEVQALRLLAMVDQNIGVVANIRGDLDRALDHYRRSLERYRELKDDRYLGQLLNNLGMIHTDLEDWDAAAEMFQEAAEVAERVEDFGARIMVETNRTELYLLQRDYAQARESCDTAFELASQYDHQLGLGEVYKNYGVIYRETGKYNLAEAHLSKAAEIAERYSNPLLAGEVQRELAWVYRALDRNQETLQALNYAHQVFSGMRARLDVADIDRRLAELEDTFLEVVRRWSESIESKDRYTAGHCQRVADYSCMLARAVGFDEKALTWFRMGAFLHDVGKTEVPEEILNKEGKLDEAEWQIMRRHTVMGEELLSAIEFPWDIRPMVRSHHEHWNGGGYPDGLKGEEIPLSARILCIADVFDALTTTRAYREAYDPHTALEIMERDAGRIFDPELFARFRALIEERLELRRAPAGE